MSAFSGGQLRGGCSGETVFADKGCSARALRGDKTPDSFDPASFPSSCTWKGDESSRGLLLRVFLLAVAVGGSRAMRAGLFAGTNSGEGNKLLIVGGEL